MLNILILSELGEGYNVAQKFIQEGHFVKYMIEVINHKSWPKHERLQEINNCKAILPYTDLCYFVSGGFRDLAEEANKTGKLVMGRGFQDLLKPGKALYEAAFSTLGLRSDFKELQLPELLVCGWFNGFKFVRTYLVQHYHRLLAGDRGPKTSSMGCVACERETFLPLLNDILKALNFKGYFGVRISCSEEEILFKKFDCILNPCTLAAIMECSNLNMTKLIDVIVNNKEEEIKFYSTEIGIAINLLNLDQAVLHNLQPVIKHFWCSNEDSSLGVVSARGNSIFEARRRVNRTLSNITDINTVYREDIGLNSIIPSIVK